MKQGDAINKIIKERWKKNHIAVLVVSEELDFLCYYAAISLSRRVDKASLARYSTGTRARHFLPFCANIKE